MNIKEVSEKFNITSDTLRYYERIGLIPPVTRNDSGYRDYIEVDLNWVYFIKCMRDAGTCPCEQYTIRTHRIYTK